MSDATNVAALDGQHAELLPSRTVLSLLSGIDLGIDGAPGTPGAPGTATPGHDMLPIDLPAPLGNSGSAGSSSHG